MILAAVVAPAVHGLSAGALAALVGVIGAPIVALASVIILIRPTKAAPAGGVGPIPPELAALLEILMDASQDATTLSDRLKAVAQALPDAVAAAIARASQGSEQQRAADLAAVGDGVTAIEASLAQIKALSADATAAGQ